MGEFGDGDPSVTSRRYQPSYPVIIVVAVVGALMFSGGWWLYAQASEAGVPGDRRAALTAAQEFAVAFNTFDSSQVDEYEDRLGPLITERLETDAAFTEHLQSLRDEAESGTLVTSEATFRAAAIEGIDDDAAEVIVAVDVTYGLTVQGQVVPPLQPAEQTWRVSAVRSGERWRVDAFDPVRHSSDADPLAPDLSESPEGEDAEGASLEDE